MKYQNNKKMYEDIKGIEIFPKKNGKDIEVKAIDDKVYSHVTTKGKGAEYTKKLITTEPSDRQREFALAAYKALKAKGKEKDISKDFNIDPKPDVTRRSDGSALITPDNGKAPYTIPERELEKYMESRIVRNRISDEKFERCDLEKISEIVDRLITDDFNATIENYTSGHCVHIKTVLDPRVTINVYPDRYGYEIEVLQAPTFETVDLWRGYNLQEFTQDFGECIQDLLDAHLQA